MARYKRKVLFTLVELLIVILIIWIILGALTYLSWRYILKLKFDADIQTFRSNYQLMLAKTLWLFWGGSYTWWLDFVSGDSVLKLWYFSWWKKNFFKFVNLDNVKIYKIHINHITVSSWSLIFRSYKVWVFFKDNLGNLYKTGNLSIWFKYAGITWDLKIYLDIGKLY